MAHELKSIQAQLRLIRTLMENSNLENSKLKAPIVSNESLRHFAGKIRHVTTEYVTHAAKSLASGGVLGLGQLNAHHVIGILSHLGTISIAHYLNTNFSKRNGTFEFLMENGIDVTHRSDIINICEQHLREDKVCRVFSTGERHLRQRMGIYSQPVAENAVCKLGQGEHSQFVETINIGPRSFLSIIKDGQLKACYKGGMQLDIVSPVVGDDRLSGLSPGVLDLSIYETPDLAVQNFCWWNSNSLLDSILITWVFNAKDNIVSMNKKQRNRRRKLKRRRHDQKETEVDKPFNTPRSGTMRACCPEPLYLWAYKKNRRTENLRSQLRTVSIQIVQSILEEMSFATLASNASNFSLNDMVNTMMSKCHHYSNYINGLAIQLQEISDFLFDEEAEAIGSKETNMQVKNTIEMVKNQILMGNRTRTLKNADLAYDPDDRRSYNFDYISYSGTNAILFPDYMVVTSLPMHYHRMIHIDDEIENLLRLVSLRLFLCWIRRS